MCYLILGLNLNFQITPSASKENKACALKSLSTHSDDKEDYESLGRAKLTNKRSPAGITGRISLPLSNIEKTSVESKKRLHATAENSGKSPGSQGTHAKKSSQNRDDSGPKKRLNLKTDAKSSFWDDSEDDTSIFSDLDRKSISRAPLRRLSRNAPSIGSFGDTYIGSSPTF